MKIEHKANFGLAAIQGLSDLETFEDSKNSRSTANGFAV